MIITMPTEAFKPLIPFMSKEETRYYLRGVYVDHGKLVATDGHRLLVIKPSEFSGDCEPFILPGDAVIKIVKTKPNKRFVNYVNIDTEKKSITIFDKDAEIVIMTFPYQPIDGTYPDYMRIVPNAEEYSEGTPATFNPKYLADLKDISDRVRLFMCNDSQKPMIFRGGNSLLDFFGLIMPMSGIEKYPIIPKWVAK